MKVKTGKELRQTILCMALQVQSQSHRRDRAAANTSFKNNISIGGGVNGTVKTAVLITR